MAYNYRMITIGTDMYRNKDLEEVTLLEMGGWELHYITKDNFRWDCHYYHMRKPIVPDKPEVPEPKGAV